MKRKLMLLLSILIIISALSVCGAQSTKSLVFQGITITLHEDKLEVVATRNGGRLWVWNEANTITSYRLLSGFLVIYGSAGEPVWNYSFIVDPTTGATIGQAGGRFLIQGGRYLYFDNYLRDDYQVQPALFDIRIRRFDTQTRTFTNLVIDPRSQVPNECIDQTDVKGFTFLRKEGTIWLYTYRSSSCVVQVRFSDSNLTPQVAIRRL